MEEHIKMISLKRNRYKMTSKKIKIKDEELRIEKKWNLTYFSLGFGLGFVSMLFLIILSTIPFINTLDELKPLDLQVVQTNKNLNLSTNFDKCFTDSDNWAVLSYHKNTSFKEEGFYCNTKDCTEEGYCKKMEIKLN